MTTPRNLELNTLLQNLPLRARSAYKGDFGHVLVIGGNKGMAGAVRLAGEAAARVGAGLVSVATHPEHAAWVCVPRPELMCHAIQKVSMLDALLKRATVLVIGPGLGQDEWGTALFLRALEMVCPKVVDADALHLLSQHPLKREDWILTPHPGEAANLLNCQTKEIQADRFSAVMQLQKRYGGVVVLKGAGTLVHGAGETEICTAGNPGMASGGMGDVLSGIIAGLLAQGLALEQAARLGVLVHALSGDRVASRKGERGLLALDLMDEVRSFLNENTN